jgi:hypothetical protein
MMNRMMFGRPYFILSILFILSRFFLVATLVRRTLQPFLSGRTFTAKELTGFT